MQSSHIRNRARSRQIIDFKGLEYGSITPTDIDALIEYNNRAYVIVETKIGDTKLPDGQRIALERLTRDLSNQGKPTICIIAEHNIKDPEQDIILAETRARSYKHKQNPWQKCAVTVKQLIDNFLDHTAPPPPIHEYMKPREGQQ